MSKHSNRNTVKRYEGLFILNDVSQEDGVKEMVDKIAAEITAQGGKVETTQKMDKRPFVRVANKKFSTGFYVNVIFQAEPHILAPLRNRFATDEGIFRVLFTEASDAVLPAAASADQ